MGRGLLCSLTGAVETDDIGVAVAASAVEAESGAQSVVDDGVTLGFNLIWEFSDLSGGSWTLG